MKTHRLKVVRRQASHLLRQLQGRSCPGPVLDREISGTGLGLVIIKRCVDLHGGMISVDSKPDAGTTLVERRAACEEADASGFGRMS